MNPVVTLDYFIRKAANYRRRIELVQQFEQDRKAFYVLKYGTLEESIVVRVKGYNTDSVRVEFLAGDGNLSHTLVDIHRKFVCRSIDYDHIRSAKKLSDSDLPTYMGMEYVSDNLSKRIKRIKQ
jgi:hypothetical protein